MNWKSATLALLALLCARTLLAADRPNVVWLLSEDNSKHYLKHFDKQGAATPAIQKLAAQGITFDHAFSCSPVCSVARTTLMTGLYAPRAGTQFHRKYSIAQLPAGWRMFPYYLRQAGYYTTNNRKKDYNAVEGKGVWDESSQRASWRKRPNPDAPFFHMQSFAQSHESSLHFSTQQMNSQKTVTNSQAISVFPYPPDTPTYRYTVARYHDRMQEIDRRIGRVVADLEADGLLEETFVFYFGDHGGVLPRSKGYIYESGLHVPLVVRVPKKWRSLIDRPLGSRAAGFVSFVDFGATVLKLAGLERPNHLDGRPFLGAGVDASEVDARDEAFGHADRFDEKYEMCRSLRKGKYKYLRNFQGYYPDALQNNYRYRMLGFQEWRQLFHARKLNAAQRQFFESKPAELLFDVEADPHEVQNLAADPEFRHILTDLRARLEKRMRQLPDLSLFPESVLAEQAMANPIAFGKDHADEIAELLRVANLSVQPFADVREQLEQALESDNPWVRYWALTNCTLFGSGAAPLAPLAKRRLEDDELLVRVRAAEFLGSIKAIDPRPHLLDVLKREESGVAAAITLNAIVFLRDGPHRYEFDVSAKDIKATGNGVSRRLEYLSN